MPQPIRIFFSIPEDLEAERATDLAALSEVKANFSQAGKSVNLIDASWDFRVEDNTPVRYRQFVMDAKKDPDNCPAAFDIYVLVLWSQFSESLSELDENALAQLEEECDASVSTGTQWEARTARKAWQASGKKPIPLIYRCRRATNDETLMEGILAVTKFLTKYAPPDELERGVYTGQDDFQKKLTHGLNNAVLEIQRLRVEPPPPPPPVLDVNPFPGLVAFNDTQHEFFYGRGREVHRFKEFFQRGNRFLLLNGPSGSGKSSFVWAGLLPELAKLGWQYLRVEPANDPLRALCRALVQTEGYMTYKKISDADIKGTGVDLHAEPLMVRLEKNPTKLADIVPMILGSDKERLLLFVDQFESVFTHDRKQDKDDWSKGKEAFLSVLDAVRNIPTLGVIATLRSDIYNEAKAVNSVHELFLETEPTDIQHREAVYYFQPPSADQVLLMMVKPSEKLGITFDEGLAEQIIYDAGGSIVLVAFTMQKLYERAKVSRRFTYADYNALADNLRDKQSSDDKPVTGVQGALREQVENALMPLRDDDEINDSNLKDALTRLFANLTRVDHDMHLACERADPSLVEADSTTRLLVDNLQRVGLLTVDNAGMKLAHEKLFDAWDELKDWADHHINFYYLLQQVKFEADIWHKKREEAQTEEEKRKVDRVYLWKYERLKPIYEKKEELLNLKLEVYVQDFIRPEEDRLLDEINNPMTTPVRRRQIGDRFAEIDYIRPGVDLRKDGLPDIRWAYTPGGQVDIDDGGMPNPGYHQPIEEFFVSRYVITFAQFEAFTKRDANGIRQYDVKRWWESLAKSSYENEPGEQVEPFPHNPVDNIAWCDAMAYCNWLDSALGDELRQKFDLAHYKIRLPTIGEWVLTAGVANNPISGLPWGNGDEAWQKLPSFSNTMISIGKRPLGHTVAVGLYPFADALHPIPDGLDKNIRALMTDRVSDVIGNIYEWLLNDQNFGVSPKFNEHRNRYLAGNCWACDTKKLRGLRFPQDFAKAERGRTAYYGFRVVFGPNLVSVPAPTA